MLSKMKIVEQEFLTGAWKKNSGNVPTLTGKKNYIIICTNL